MKIRKDLPCEYQEWSDAAQKDITRYPSVNCMDNCAKCGWNPAVAAKRIRKKTTKVYVMILPTPTASWGLPPWKPTLWG